MDEGEDREEREESVFWETEGVTSEIINDEMLESPLLMALKQRIIEYASDLECFVLKVVRNIDLERPERCGHKFCYSCGAEYRDGQQTCQCASWEEEPSEDVVTHPAQQFEQWAWESFGSLSTMMDAYSEQERSQLALIQRFLSGGFGLSDHHPHQSPPRCTDSYVDAMKDLHQLPWLERFVSVISDNYADDYVQ
ncbi:hypothetical protein RJ640_021503 [Escallonia rubra]|uniref:RING-type domain-containing protein n=1 Tax=Escallonia rubra TaxID=112253 RepID=A0AA88U053_9ASTE|nr:hypothetical protein RJ640_021503 [Escallonia rubra]